MPAAGYRLKARRCYVRVSDARVDVFQRTCIVVRGSTKRVFNEPKEKRCGLMLPVQGLMIKAQ